MDACTRLFEIFSSLFLNRSAEMGLINLKSLALAGDGTPFTRQHRSVKNVPATVWKTESGTVNATAYTDSLTATSDGILIGTGITSDTIYTC